MEKHGVVSLGEAFIDYISTDSTNTQFQKLLGGATVNVAVGTSRLGVPTYYLCKLGNDSISIFVKNQLEIEKVNTEYCLHSEMKEICKVIVHLNSESERYFHSYHNPTPNEVLEKEELNEALFAKAKVFYFGSGTLFQSTAKDTTLKALEYAKKNGMFVTFDANIRLKRWDSEEYCRETVQEFIKKADVVKLSEEELFFLTNVDKLNDGLQALANWNIPYVFITLGKNGAIALYQGNQIHVPAKLVDAKDTTGAGDAFMSALLYCFHEVGKSSSRLNDYLQFANEIGALTTTQLGSLSASIDYTPLKDKYFLRM
jgi:fructokinase